MPDNAGDFGSAKPVFAGSIPARCSKRISRPHLAPDFPAIALSLGLASEILSESHFAFDCRLIGGDAALKEISQLLHILEIHEGERILCVKYRSDAEALETRVGHIAEILAHVAQRETGNPAGQQVFRKLYFGVHSLTEHDNDLLFKVRIPKIGLLRTNDIHHLEGELKVTAFISKDPVGSGGKTVQQPF